MLFTVNNIPISLEKKDFIQCAFKGLNIAQAFNMTWYNIVKLTHALVKHGHYSMVELFDQEYYFVKYLYDNMVEELENERKEEEKRNKEYEKQSEYKQNQMMSQYNNMSSNYNMPSLPPSFN